MVRAEFLLFRGDCFCVALVTLGVQCIGGFICGREVVFSGGFLLPVGVPFLN